MGFPCCEGSSWQLPSPGTLLVATAGSLLHSAFTGGVSRLECHQRGCFGHLPQTEPSSLALSFIPKRDLTCSPRGVAVPALSHGLGTEVQQDLALLCPGLVPVLSLCAPLEASLGADVLVVPVPSELPRWLLLPGPWLLFLGKLPSPGGSRLPRLGCSFPVPCASLAKPPCSSQHHSGREGPLRSSPACESFMLCFPLGFWCLWP